MNELLFAVATSVIKFFVIVTLIKNYFFLIISPFYGVKERLAYIRSAKAYAAKHEDAFSPKISVVVPAWNEEVGIMKTIASIMNNGYDNFQLIVVNDGSTDKSDAIIKEFQKKLATTYPLLSKKFTYKYKKNGGKGAALNTGIKLATGEIVLTVDADSALKIGSLEKLAKYYLDPTVDAVVGNVEVTNSESIVGLAQQLEYYFGFYNKRAHSLLGAEYIFGGACASFRRSIFEKIGYFDEVNKTEDIEMSMRTKFYGLKSKYAEDVVCYTEGASAVSSLIQQRIRWKKGRVDTFFKYRNMFFSTEDEHNFFLSFFVLPLSVMSEIQLLFEPVAISALIAYSIVTSEFVSLSLGLLFIGLVFLIVPLFHDSRPRPVLFVYFPFFWPLFLFLDWIEFLSLAKTIKMIRQKKDVEWQRWQRKGIELDKKEQIA